MHRLRFHGLRVHRGIRFCSWIPDILSWALAFIWLKSTRAIHICLIWTLKLFTSLFSRLQKTIGLLLRKYILVCHFHAFCSFDGGCFKHEVIMEALFFQTHLEVALNWFLCYLELGIILWLLLNCFILIGIFYVLL